jgi:hypothetical protein
VVATSVLLLLRSLAGPICGPDIVTTRQARDDGEFG